MLKTSTHKSTIESRIKLLQTDLFFSCPLFFSHDQTKADTMLHGMPKQHMTICTGQRGQKK